METPHQKPLVRNADDCTHSLRLAVEVLVAKQAAHENGHFVLLTSYANHAVSLVAQTVGAKTQVAGEESGTTQSKQEGDNFIVFHPFSPYFVSDLTFEFASFSTVHVGF